MAAISEGRLPYSLWSEEAEAVASPPTFSSHPSDAVLFFGFSLVLGLACTHLLRCTKVPYTVALLVLGIALGFAEYAGGHHLGTLGNGIRMWANIDPDLLLAIFIPVLIFEGAYSMEAHQIKRCMVQMLLLAGPGVLISTFFIGSALKLAFPYGWNWKTCLLLGAILSATDPVAVVALLKELGISKKMTTIIEGESMMNDGASLVVFNLFFRMALGQGFNWLVVVKSLSLGAFGAVGIGIAFGLISIFWLKFLFNDALMDASVMLAVSFVAYYTAQEVAGVSGILTTVALGMVFAAAKASFKTRDKESLQKFWEVITYVANTIIFILSGVLIAQSICQSGNHHSKSGNSWAYLFLLYVIVQVARGLVVTLLYPALWYFGYGLDWKEAIVLVWSGLRGAVGLALALSVKDGSGDSKYLNSETANLFVFLTGGIVFLTLVGNGSTTPILLSLFGMDALSQSEGYELSCAMRKLQKHTEEICGNFTGDDDFGAVDWPTVRSNLPCLSSNTREANEPLQLPITRNYVDPVSTTAMRMRLLKAARAAYLRMLNDGRINETTANVLLDSVDTAIDLSSEGPLCDWKCLLVHMKFPEYLDYLQAILGSEKFVRMSVVNCLQSACYKCAAFLDAHEIARGRLLEFFGENEIACVIMDESKSEAAAARKYVEAVKCTFPEILRVVKGREVTWSILNSLNEFVGKFEEFEMLDKKAVLHLRELVQDNMERLSKSPPQVKIRQLREIISTHPFLNILPPAMCDALQCCARETIKPSGSTLYQGGSRPNKIWLISYGMIKSEGYHSHTHGHLSSTFSQGSILGLFEALVGKPYYCSMVTEFVALCISFEVNAILHLITSDHQVDNLFWKESIVVMSKLLLPQVFEKMSMEEMREHIANRSVMEILSEDKSVEISCHSIAFLLNGYLRAQDSFESITSPAVLLLPDRRHFPSLDITDENVENLWGKKGPGSAISCHFASQYKVERTAKIIRLDFP